MAYLDRGNTDFQTETRRAVYSRSPALLGVDQALIATQRQASRHNLVALLKALQRWHDSSRSEFVVRGRNSGAYTGLWSEVEARLGQRVNIWSSPGVKSWSNTPNNWVSARKEQLDRMKSYGSMDMMTGSPSLTPCCKQKIQFRHRNKAAGTFTCPNCAAVHPEAAAEVDWSRGFAQCVNAGNRQTVLRAYRDAMARNAQSGMPAPRPGPWDAAKAKSSYDQVNQEKAGICTQFAYAAAHILTFNRPTGPRVEVVSFTNHVYVVVGRRGKAVNPGEKLPPLGKWKSSFSIVDPWAGAMGYEVVYKRTQGFPYTTMMSPLTLFMSREAT